MEDGIVGLIQDRMGQLGERGVPLDGKVEEWDVDIRGSKCKLGLC
jgi:hypothetical protein